MIYLWYIVNTFNIIITFIFKWHSFYTDFQQHTYTHVASLALVDSNLRIINLSFIVGYQLLILFYSHNIFRDRHVPSLSEGQHQALCCSLLGMVE